MRIKEIMEQSDAAYNPDAGFLRNVGRAGLDRFTQSELGIDAYDRESLRREQAARAQRQRAERRAAQTPDRAEIPADTASEPSVQPAVDPQAAAASNTPAVDPGAEPQVYHFDDRALNPQNPNDAKIIKQLQAAGVTSARSGIPRTK
jgi:hypothetical protein